MPKLLIHNTHNLSVWQCLYSGTYCVGDLASKREFMNTEVMPLPIHIAGELMRKVKKREKGKALYAEISTLQATVCMRSSVASQKPSNTISIVEIT